MSIKEESRVRFKDDYAGYFQDLKGKTLTVMQVIEPQPRSFESPRVTLAEIEEIHLISTFHLREVTDETTS